MYLSVDPTFELIYGRAQLLGSKLFLKGPVHQEKKENFVIIYSLLSFFRTIIKVMVT